MKSHFKTIVIFFTLLLLFSCNSTKKLVSEKQSDNTTVTDTIPKITKVDTEIIKPIEEVQEKSVTPELITEQFDHQIFDNLLKENISENGGTNYKGFIKSKTLFKSYLTSLSEKLPQNNWSKENKLAYWMNAYNAFTIKLIIDNYPTKSIKNIKDPWNKRFFMLGGKWYNLNEIEHKILRKMNDPRIHFGINCASFSCPTLSNKAFTAENVYQQLNLLAYQFINDKKRNTITENTVQISKIFQWFGKDFKTEGTLIDYLNKYSDIHIAKKAKINFKKYDWNLNE